jgi:hypothetical protein
MAGESLVNPAEDEERTADVVDEREERASDVVGVRIPAEHAATTVVETVATSRPDQSHRLANLVMLG